jgi:protein XRP2
MSAAPKKKINRADYMFNQLTGQTVMKVPGSVDGIQFAIRYLDSCDASLYDYSAQVFKYLF